MLGLEITHRHEDGDGRGRKKEIEEVEGKAVDQHGAQQAKGAGRVGHPELDFVDAGGGEENADEGGDGVGPLHLLRQHEVDQKDAEREQRQQRDRQREKIIGPGH